MAINIIPQQLKSVRNITKRAFMRRFTSAERSAIRKSTDDDVIDIHEDLKMASKVDLKLQDTIDAVNYLAGVNILQSHRVEAILADGTEEEKA